MCLGLMALSFDTIKFIDMVPGSKDVVAGCLDKTLT
jgi:hypothetical protein